MKTSPPPRVLAVVVATAALFLSSIAPALAYIPGLDPRDGKQEADLTEEEILAGSSTAPGTSQECVDGMAGPFPCSNVDLASVVSLAELGGGTGSDVWGWTDPVTGQEYAIMGTSNGVAFVDVTTPTAPVVRGLMPTQSVVTLPLWRDIKVHDDHAFVVSEHDLHGMQVFDLTRLRGAVAPATPFTPDTVYTGFSSAHNVAINEDTGFAYAVGTETCNGGLHMVDVRDPVNPTFAGCFADDGYTHDATCVVYDGVDGRFKGREICFAFNEDTVTIVDVSDKANPVMLSRTGYATADYTHQGDLTDDHRWVLFNDEGDEAAGTVENTTTYIMELDHLDRPGTVVPFAHETPSIDHNLYVEDGLVWESNYTAGLRILDFDRKSLEAGRLTEVGYFDVFPASDVDEFAGTWSNYPYFDSGTVVVSTLESGLFVLLPDVPRDDGSGRPGQGPK